MKKLTLLSLIFLTFFACRKDIDETLSTTDTTSNPITEIINYIPEVIPVTATLFGTVTDEAGIPIAGAFVKLDGINETADANGRFVFKNLIMNAAGTFVEASRSGYFSGSHRFFPEEGSVNYATISLLAKSNTGNFVSSDGGVITSSEGIQVDFPANSVVNANGDAYDGTVEVSARWIDPTADNLQALMPGNLQGISSSLEEVALASFGMIAIELESPGGASLNLGNDLKATLSIPIPAGLLANAPAEIPLWYFDNDYGLWVQEGMATLQGNMYVGEVAHFSFWNYDAPAPYIELSGTIVSDSGSPIPNAIVRLTIVSSGSSACGWTDNDGVFSGKVPDNEEFVMTVSLIYGSCDVYMANIGPFTVDTDLGIITVGSSELLDITGTIVDCNNDPVTNGWLELTLSGTTYTYYVDDGNISMTVFNCDNATSLTVVAVNIDDLEASSELSFTVVDPLDLGEIQACGNTLPEWLEITVDGVTTTFLDVSILLGGIDSSYISGSLPGTNYNINLQMNDFSAEGTYPGTIVQYSYMRVPISTGDADMESAVYNDLVITQFAQNVGDTMIGSFSGTGLFFDNMQQQVNLPFTADFQIIRD
ncbi:MAG: hypothetical protein ACI8VT_003662 [Saprospiraceae bacterium]|jgi:hypothetical protein